MDNRMGLTEKTRRLLLWVAVLALCWLLLFPIGTPAHPMGNFSINHYSGIRVEQGFIELRYLIDMAEIPTFQELQQNNISAQASDPQVRAYLARQAESYRKNLLLTLNGKPLTLEIASQDISFAPGAGQLPTMKIGLVLRAGLQETQLADVNDLRYGDGNFPKHAGWKEIVAASSGQTEIISSSVPSHDRSTQLTNYPTDLLSSPPQQLEARVTFRASHPTQAATQEKLGLQQQERKNAATPNAIRMEPNRQATPRSSFTELMATKQLGIGIVILAGIIAAGLGALHALEPGHGKTIVAAYLVGSRGTASQAVFLGLIVTASHTAGVYLLGAITLWAQRYIVPEQVYPILGMLSGLIIAGLGFYLFLQRYIGVAVGLSHTHAGFAHSHTSLLGFSNSAEEGETRDHGAEIKAVTEKADRMGKHVPLRELLALGITGGIIPCPAALVVLLSAVALHRVGFGLFLILSFSVGLAAVLMAMGLLMVFARNFMSRFRNEGPLFTRWLPMASAGVMSVLGVGIAAKALLAAGIVQIHWPA
jgi:ABC-type nickel/cobalt efflux system permease component RcnA